MSEIQRLILAGLLAGAALVGAAPASAQVFSLDPRPDLTITQTASPNHVVTGGAITAIVTVNNRRAANLPATTASGVRVTYALSSGTTFQSASADSGLACGYIASLRVVDCSGGTIAADGVARITILAAAPPVATTFTGIATADPFNTIGERNETNNTATDTVSVGIADLAVSIAHEVTESHGWNGFTYYGHTWTVTVRNEGTRAATGVTVDVATGGLGANRSSAGSEAFECSPGNLFGNAWRCSGGSIPAGGVRRHQCRE